MCPTFRRCDPTALSFVLRSSDRPQSKTKINRLRTKVTQDGFIVDIGFEAIGSSGIKY
jgi:hypothetical protein